MMKIHKCMPCCLPKKTAPSNFDKEIKSPIMENPVQSPIITESFCDALIIRLMKYFNIPRKTLEAPIMYLQHALNSSGIFQDGMNDVNDSSTYTDKLEYTDRKNPGFKLRITTRTHDGYSSDNKKSPCMIELDLCMSGHMFFRVYFNVNKKLSIIHYYRGVPELERVIRTSKDSHESNSSRAEPLGFDSMLRRLVCSE